MGFRVHFQAMGNPPLRPFTLRLRVKPPFLPTSQCCCEVKCSHVCGSAFKTTPTSRSSSLYSSSLVRACQADSSSQFLAIPDGTSVEFQEGGVLSVPRKEVGSSLPMQWTLLRYRWSWAPHTLEHCVSFWIYNLKDKEKDCLLSSTLIS